MQLQRTNQYELLTSLDLLPFAITSLLESLSFNLKISSFLLSF
jgi:hypothetical protein